MRYRGLIGSLLIALAIAGCKSKPILSEADAKYVRTTIALIQVRSSLTPGSDSMDTKRRLDSLYKKCGTSKDAYLAETKVIGSDPARAGLVYSTIKDSLAKK